VRSLAVLLFAAAASAAELPRLVPAGVVSVGSRDDATRRRLSPDGRWMALAGPAKNDPARNTWWYRGFTLVDLHAGKVARESADRPIGQNAPVFDRDAGRLAWCSGGRLHTVELATGAERSEEIAPLRGTDESATLCAISRSGRRVVVAVRGRDARSRTLLVVDLGGDGAEPRVRTRIEDYKEPYLGGYSYDVVLRGDLLVHHSRSADGVSGADYRLLLTDLATGEERARFGAYVTMATAGFHLTRDGATLFHGDGNYDVARTDIATGRTTRLLNAHDALYSHFLEMTVSPDDRLVVSWSVARHGLVVWDRRAKQRTDVPLDHGARVLGVAADNRHAVLLRGKRIEFVDLAERKGIGPLQKAEWDWAVLDPTGRTLVGCRRAREGLELHVFRVETGSGR